MYKRRGILMENPCPECGHVCDCDAHVQETARAEPITHEWLKSVGFRWAEWERSGGKHWILWFGNCREERELSSAAEDVGIELAEPINLEQFGWSCWLRSDFSHKYGRFIHIRHVWTQQLMLADGGEGQRQLARWLPVLANVSRKQGRATAYICENYICNLPTPDPQVVSRLLDGTQ